MNIRILSPLILCALMQTFAGVTQPLVTIHAELDREVLPADERQTAVVKISLDAAEPPREVKRPPVNLCIVLDRSGSMQGSKIEHAREAALEALSRLGKQDVFSLVTYHSSVETLIPAGTIRDIRRARDLIRGIQPGGNTALFGGVSQGANEIRKTLEDHAEGMVHRLILLSDGLANVGPSTPEDLGRLGASLMKEGISVTTVGVGNDYNEDLMTQLSQRSDGNSYFVENSNDLARIFNEEIGDVLSVVARQVEIIIECPKNVRPVRTIGRDAVIRGQKVKLNLNQLYGRQEKYLLLEVEVPPTPAEQELPVVSAVVNYHNIFTQSRESQRASINARFSQKEEEVLQSVNGDVQTEYFYNESANAKDQAIQLWEEGRREEAKQLLEDNSVRLRQAAEQYELPALDLEAANLDTKARDLKKEGLTPSNRKELRTESYQDRNQQRVKQSWFQK